MAQRKRNVTLVKWEGNNWNDFLGAACLHGWAGPETVEDIKLIEGVHSVTISDTEPNKFYLWVDPRYDTEDIIKEIEALNSSNVPEIFNDV